MLWYGGRPERVGKMQIKELLEQKAQQPLCVDEKAICEEFVIDQKVLQKAITELLASESTTVEVLVRLDDLAPISMHAIAFAQSGSEQRVIMKGAYQPAGVFHPTAQLVMILVRNNKAHDYVPLNTMIRVLIPRRQVILSTELVII